MAFLERYVTAIGAGGNGLTEPTAFTWAQAKTDWSGTGGQGKRYNIKADGTYSLSGFQDIGNSGGGTAASPVVLRGYKTVIGDGYLGRTGSNGPLITTNMPTFDMNNGGCYTGARTVIETINFQGFNGDNILYVSNYVVVIGCRMYNNGSSSGTCAVKMGEAAILHECDVLMPATSLSTAAGGAYLVQVQGGASVIDSCRLITACGSSGINCERHTAIIGCLIKGAGAGAGIVFGGDTARNPTIRNNTIVGWLDGVRADIATDWPFLVAGNMITDCGGYAVNLTAATATAVIGPNRTRDNVLGDYTGGGSNWQLAGRIIPLVTSGAGTSDYVNAAAGDFNLVAGSPARGVNLPYFTDLGCYDHQDPTGGGGSAVFHPLRNFIIRPA